MLQLVIPITKKVRGETVKAFLEHFKTFAEKQTGKHLKPIQSDKARDFLVLDPWLASHDIVHIPINRWVRWKDVTATL